MFAAVGAVQELVASRVMEHRMGLVREAYEHGQAARLGRAAEVLTVAGLLGTVFLGRPQPRGCRRVGAGPAGGQRAAAVPRFDAGVESTKDPKYVVVPQRERLDARRVRTDPQAGTASAARSTSAMTILCMPQHRLERPLGPGRVRVG